MYRLFGAYHTGTCAVQAALAEIGADFEFELVSTKDGAHMTEVYRRINPRQQVPALELGDGSVMTEGPAILLYLADAHPAKQLAPEPGSTERGLLTRWLLFFAANVYEGELRKLFGERYTDDPDGGAAVQRAAAAYVERHYLIFEENLGKGPYFFGDQFTILDIYVWMLSQWMDGAWMRENCPKVVKLANCVMERPNIQPIHAEHFG